MFFMLFVHCSVKPSERCVAPPFCYASSQLRDQTFLWQLCFQRVFYCQLHRGFRGDFGFPPSHTLKLTNSLRAGYRWSTNTCGLGPSKKSSGEAARRESLGASPLDSLSLDPYVLRHLRVWLKGRPACSWLARKWKESSPCIGKGGQLR